MCIRDRLLAALTLAAEAPILICDEPTANLDAQSRAAFFAAVSYTHLRAHETVLDLVCRLLLEKKKTYPQKRPTLTNRALTKRPPPTKNLMQTH